MRDFFNDLRGVFVALFGFGAYFTMVLLVILLVLAVALYAAFFLSKVVF